MNDDNSGKHAQQQNQDRNEDEHFMSLEYFKHWSATMAHSVQLWLETQRYWFRISAESDVFHRGCRPTYPVLQTFQMPGVFSVVYGGSYCAL